MMSHANCLEDLQKGIEIVIVCDNANDLRPPEWMEAGKFHKGRQFFQEFVCSVIFGWLCALLVGFAVPSLSRALFFTAESLGADKARKRYLDTLVHLSSWHLEDIFDPNSGGHRSLLRVGGMHDLVRDRLTAQSGSANLTQYDFALVQSGFVGPIILYPEFLGIQSEELLEAFVHFWSVVGHCLGIQDEFNICISGLGNARSLCKEVEQGVIVPNLLEPSTESQQLAEDFICGFQRLFPWLSQNLVSAFIFPSMGLPTPKLTLKEHIVLVLLKIHFWAIGHLSFYRNFLNKRVLQILTSLRSTILL